ncbi:VWA domain-containing protein [Streptomyces sp. NPDC048361]|uniref:VWA domain-containing protein n=1 Tax=Streptomyces sp. NPDC048361 TaxID=3154720 RepID=UPI00343DD3F6
MPALSLQRVEERAPALVSLYKSAAESLEKHGLDDETAAVHLVVDHPGSDPHSHQFDFLRRLDEPAVPAYRRVDNAGYFAAGGEPRRMTDAQLYDRLPGEFPNRLRSARVAGIVR